MLRRLPYLSISAAFQPCFFICLAFVGGISTAHWLAAKHTTLIAFSLVAYVTAIILVSIRKELWATIAIFAAFFLLGGLLLRLEDSGKAPTRLQRLYEEGKILPAESAEVFGTLVREPEPAPERVYLEMEAEMIRTLKREFAASGRLRLMLTLNADNKDEYESLKLEYGKRLRVLVALNRAEQYKNPGCVDFNEYLERKGYDFVAVLKSPLLIEVVGAGKRNRLLAALYRFRLRMLESTDAAFNRSVAGVLKAAIWANRYFLDFDTAEKLRAGGTFHVLVISGMNVGFIAVAMILILSKLIRWRLVRILLIMIALWAYTLMIGADMAVLRATVMIGIALFAKTIFRTSPAINTVGLSALILLVYQPGQLFDPGFQLTYLTVLMIVLVSLPLTEKLRAIGQWQPTADTPYPPNCSRATRWIAEVTFWRQSQFDKDMKTSPIKYRLDKARAALLVDRLRLSPILPPAIMLVVTSVSIQVGLLPVMVIFFNRVTPIAVLLNIVIGLFMVALIFSSFAVLIIKPLSAHLAAKLSWIVNLSHYLLVNSSSPFLENPIATFRVPNYTGWPALFYAIYFLPILYFIYLIHCWQPLELTGHSSQARRGAPLRRIFNQRRLQRSSAFSLVALFFIIAFHPFSYQVNEGKLQVSFLDVGQGDCIFVRFPRGATMLIDSGGRVRRYNSDENEEQFEEDVFRIGESVVSRYLWNQGISRLDYIAITHAHADHIQGFADVIKNFQIGRALTGIIPAAREEFAALKSQLDKKGVPLQELRRGESLSIDGVKVEIIWPPGRWPQAISSNNESLVMRLSYGKRAILLTGDIEHEVEKAIEDSGQFIRSDVIKAPHHGSRTSSSPGFLQMVRPEWAIISVGQHSVFNHPHVEVLRNYRQVGSKVILTGRSGTVTVITDGEQLEVSTYSE